MTVARSRSSTNSRKLTSSGVVEAVDLIVTQSGFAKAHLRGAFAYCENQVRQILECQERSENFDEAAPPRRQDRSGSRLLLRRSGNASYSEPSSRSSRASHPPT